MPPRQVQIKSFKLMKFQADQDFTVPEGYQFMDIIQSPSKEGGTDFYVWLLKLPPKATFGTTGQPAPAVGRT